MYEIASSRQLNGKNNTEYHEFGEDLDYGHLFIYQDPFLIYYIM